MAYIFNYVVLTAIPDRGRGERVNIGLIVFGPERIDVRLGDLEKLRALTGASWQAYAEDFKLRLLIKHQDPVKALRDIAQSRRLDPYFEASDVAWFSVGGASEYEASILELMKSMVLRKEEPSLRLKVTRLNTKVAKVLKQAKALAKRDEPIEEHKVHRGIVIEENLSAEFAQKNGVWRVAATLDCTLAPSMILREGGLKAITLDRARARFGEDARLLGIYAPSKTEDSHAKTALHFLKTYSDQQFNWEDHDERQSLINIFYQGMGVVGSLM